MKELSIEEKAKAYDKAVEIISDYYQKIKYSSISNDTSDREVLERAFPQLKESRDEKIRNRIIALVNAHGQGMYKDKMLAWLEKQGEQKSIDPDTLIQQRVDALADMVAEQNPTDKVEPKFHEGDWVVYKDAVWKVCNISLQNYYELLKINNEVSTRLIEDVDENAHLWTTQDAKDGDVLAVELIEGYSSSFVAIYKKQNEEDFDSYCFVGFDGKFYNGVNGHSMKNIHPATKEQCDLLFQKMKEAGYEWDAEKKELKKIEQKPAWSEEDENGLGDALWAIKQARTIAKDENDMGNLWYAERWLKSLKDRVQPQPKQEWSEEDDERLSDAIFFVREYQIPTRDKRLLNAAKEAEDWLKSLRPQNTWKPSDEQMLAINTAINVIGKGTLNGKQLIELQESLRKLKGE